MKLTPAQIESWRTILVTKIGPYALIAPDEVIQKIKDKYQKIADTYQEDDNESEKERNRI